MEEIKQILKELIDQRGVRYLDKNAYEVYTELKSQKIDLSMARIVLIALLAGVSEKAEEMDESGLSKYIQKECCLKKSAADKLAVLFASLFEKKNMEEWAERDEDLEDYVTCDDYYPPVMEDYYCEDVLEKFCREQGFKLISYTCDGDMSDFEPNDDRW